MLRIAPFRELLSHFRFMLTLRSDAGKYHNLILFRLAAGHDQNLTAPSKQSKAPDQLYVMEATCPHLGADMSHADIEEMESSVVAVCPWHR
jgi:hypothetical protein